MTPLSRSRSFPADLPAPDPARPLRRVAAAERDAPAFRPRPEAVASSEGALRLELSPDDRVGIAPHPRSTEAVEARPSSVWRSIGFAVVGILAIIGAVTLLRLAGSFILG
jgi:hypothetical protein